ncbi:MAG TPA: anhydro-N-acetylmuramic acid kinase [Verrucomicrobiae bacterium]|nr:anhydro-N-acetylmuramic acid kinase [Verrucomicrobiae bacterium]
MNAVGLMSGTSLDGIDAALVRIVPRNGGYAIDLLNFVTVPFEDDLDRRLRAALPPHDATASAIADLHRGLGAAFARAARSACGALAVDYVASHGQTIFHDGAAHRTMQIGDPFVIREALRATVCYDFRSADCVVGGSGAPLVPYADAILLADPGEDRVALNIGGIANLTALPHGCSPHDIIAFDCGPGMMLIDAFVQMRSGGKTRFDADGALAETGVADETALTLMLRDPYFEQSPPKSTGRERFGAQFLLAHRHVLDRLTLEDGCATLTELTARTIAGAVSAVGMTAARVLCSGGGAQNRTLMRRISAHLPQARVERSDAAGLNADAKEAIAFAMLGYETLRERAANVPRATGASHAVPLGAIAPFALHRLMTEVENECRLS